MGGLRELASVTAACRELRNLFDRSEIWAERCGMRVANLHQLSEHFSTFLLARYVHGRRTHAHLERNILLGLGDAPESQLLSSSSVTEVFVCEAPQDEQAFWTKRLSSSLRTSAVPTVSQVEQLQTALAVVLGIAEDGMEAMATIEEIVAMASGDGTNNVLRAAVFALLCDPGLIAHTVVATSGTHTAEATVDKKDSAAGAEGEPREEVDARLAEMSTVTGTGEQPPKDWAPPLIGDRGFAILADVGTAQHAVGFLHGLNVDELMEEKWKLKKKKGMPAAVQRAFLDAFASFSFVQLCDFWRTPGFWKAFFRSTRMNKLILRQVASAGSSVAATAASTASTASNSQESKKKLTCSTADLLKVGFFLSALHEEKYPESAEKFVQLNWGRRIVEPMRAMCTHPLFAARDPAWLLPEFQAELAGKKLKLPVRNSLPAVLSRDGNTAATWLKLFEANAVTVPQVLGHLRSLALIEFPVSKVEQLIVSKLETGAASMGLAELMRIRTLLATGIFTADQIEGLRARVQVAEHEPGVDQCRVAGIAMSFRDKKGQSSTQQKTKNVGWNFGIETVQGYQTMAQKLLAAQLNAQPAAAADTIAAVVLTHELRDNLVRTGIPPRTPAYAPASLWRGEALALERLDAVSEDAAGGPTPELELESDKGQHETSSLSRFENLIVGITWCEHPSDSIDPKYHRVDLDLSVIAFDQNWRNLAHCSYTLLQAPGMKHSGDLTSAPHPDGAREDVRVNLSELPSGTRYLALTVHNYTRQPMDECCADASVFVASTRPGLGPGGLDIISSAAMKGKGTNVLCGVLHLADGESAVHRFICCDQEMLSGTAAERAGNNVETTKDQVGRTALSVLDGSGLSDAPTKPRLTEIAAFASTGIADTVLIEHAGSADMPTASASAEKLLVLHREESETRYEFASRVRASVSELRPTATPTYPFRSSLRDAPVPPKHLVVFGGELEQKDATRLLSAIALPKHKTRPQPTAVLVNLRSNQEQVQRQTVGRSDPYWTVLVGGADAMPAIGKAIEESREEAAAKAKEAEDVAAQQQPQQVESAAAGNDQGTKRPTSAPAAGGGSEATANEQQKWAKRMQYRLGMVYVAETAVPVQVSKELDSAPVCINVDGPELTLDQDDLVQAVGMDITQGPDGKSLPRVKIDCRSLIALRTDAEELAPEQITGWVSVFADRPAGAKGRPDAILAPVPEQHIIMGVKAILEARGGYVEPELLKAAEGAATAAPKVDKQLHAAMTAWHDEDLCVHTTHDGGSTGEDEM